MKELLIEILENIGFPIFQQCSLNKDDKYPDSFFTFWNNAADGDSFYDNENRTTIWDFDLNFYSTDPNLVNNKLLEAKKLLRDSGFIVSGDGYDVASDEVTHTGRGINIKYIKKEEF